MLSLRSKSGGRIPQPARCCAGASNPSRTSPPGPARPTVAEPANRQARAPAPPVANRRAPSDGTSRIVHSGKFRKYQNRTNRAFHTSGIRCTHCTTVLEVPGGWFFETPGSAQLRTRPARPRHNAQSARMGPTPHQRFGDGIQAMHTTPQQAGARPPARSGVAPLMACLGAFKNFEFWSWS